MQTYIVTIADHGPLPKTNEEAQAIYTEKLFTPLQALAEESNGQLTVVNELKFIGVAVVETTDEGAKLLREKGFKVNVNGTVRAL